MAKLREQQKIVFKHPINKQVSLGVYYNGIVFYLPENPLEGLVQIPYSYIKEWCDAEAAFKAWSLQQVRTGNFEWNEGPTVEPETI